MSDPVSPALGAAETPAAPAASGLNFRTPEQPILDAICRQAPLSETLAAICQYVAAGTLTPVTIHLCQGGRQNLAASTRLPLGATLETMPATEPQPAHERSFDLLSMAQERLGRLTVFDSAPETATASARVAAACRLATIAVELRNLLGELQFRAEHDTLTGLLLRSALPNLPLKPLAPESAEPWTLVLYLDIDGLGRINEILGTLTADNLLRTIGQRIQAALGPLDEAVRCGGDEFLLVLHGIGGLSEALPAADQIRRLISEPIEIDGHQLLTTVSIGVAVAQPGDNIEKLERASRLAANLAKKRGRNRIELYDRSLQTETSDRLLIERALRSASQDGSLQLWLQPKIHLADGVLAGVESLLRWRHPDLGIVSPTQFIPIAEETGLVAQLGDWALREACRLHRRCLELGFPEIRFAVNVSPLQFQNPLLAHEIESTLRAFDVQPQMLELEITETALIEHFGEVVDAIHGLRSLGVRFAIDDFGTGHSSLSYLNSLPVDAVKIDRSFIREIDTRPGRIAFLDSIIRLARSLDFRVVVEGVETALQDQIIRQLGCDEGQGYIYSRPLAFDAFYEWARQRPELARSS